MSAVVEIPTVPRPRTITVPLGAVSYRLRFHFASASEAGWLLDIATAGGSPLLCGLPLLPGVDLLAQHASIGIAGQLFVVTETGAAPAFADLGSTARVYFAPN